MRSVHTINLICRAERLSESNYGVMQQKDEGAAGGGRGEAVGRTGRINSIRCRHTCLMYMHIIHGCDATFLCGLPPRTVSRDALLLIYRPVYELRTHPNSAQTGVRVGFPGFTCT